MDIKNLKSRVEQKILSDDPIILKYSDNKFLCYHYIDNIANSKNMKKVVLDSLNIFNEPEDVFGMDNDSIYIYDVDKLDVDILPDYKNLIVVCKDIKVNLSIDFTDIPSLIGWQIEDYLKTRLKGLDENQIKWLCDISKYNIYRLDNECKKIEIFNDAGQKAIFQQMNRDDAYCDLNSLNIFNFTNAILKKDYSVINEILSNLRYIDIEGTGVVTILLRNFKNIIDVQMTPNCTASSLNMNPKQFNAIKYNVGKFTNNQLINIYEFLTSVDYKLKSGNLTFSTNVFENNSKLAEYITLTVLNLGSN